MPRCRTGRDAVLSLPFPSVFYYNRMEEYAPRVGGRLSCDRHRGSPAHPRGTTRWTYLSYRNKQLSWCFGVVDLMEFIVKAPLSEIIWISLNHKAAIRKITNLGQRALNPRVFLLETWTL